MSFLQELLTKAEELDREIAKEMKKELISFCKKSDRYYIYSYRELDKEEVCFTISNGEIISADYTLTEILDVFADNPSFLKKIEENCKERIEMYNATIAEKKEEILSDVSSKYIYKRALEKIKGE